ncbi:diacylglycerol lipase-beta isoform X2 [Zalophus californianus]|uniref:Diacylglycerol lipase-beta isoform X2 n=1 Tax=Zalophus californianus TaxID=9704 RepID=A0A6J2ENS5_ZALCA|nr:diacylglycerol lipase-beta isoform X2 [Zalophus californianus]
MPGMVLFGRRWAIASDDLVFPGFFELSLRVVWWIGILTLYLMHRGKLDCAGGTLLSSYLIVLLVLLAVIICTVSAIVCVSMKGTICNPGPRKSMSKLLYFRLALFLPEMVWASLGAAWIADDVQCDRTVVSGIIATVIISWIIIVSTVVTIIIVFDPLGGKMAPYPSSGPNHLDSHDSSQLLNSLKTAATSVWETRIKFLCCCVGKDDHTRVAFSSTAELFSTYFSDTDLVPSDIAAGLTLLHQQQDSIRNSQEPDGVIGHSPGHPQEADLDAELANCHHYMQFAAAAYGWPLYIYQNPFTGLCKIGGDCCRSRTTEYDLVGGDQLHCHFGSILHTTGLQYRDFIHISFHDKVYELPFLVALDHRKESVVVAVRGTMSLQDILTDLSAENETLNLECGVQDCSAHKRHINSPTTQYPAGSCGLGCGCVPRISPQVEALCVHQVRAGPGLLQPGSHGGQLPRAGKAVVVVAAGLSSASDPGQSSPEFEAVPLNAVLAFPGGGGAVCVWDAGQGLRHGCCVQVPFGFSCPEADMWSVPAAGERWLHSRPQGRPGSAVVRQEVLFPNGKHVRPPLSFSWMWPGSAFSHGPR